MPNWVSEDNHCRNHCTINTTLLIVDVFQWHLNKPITSVSSFQKAFAGSQTQKLISYAFVDNHINKPVKFKYSS